MSPDKIGSMHGKLPKKVDQFNDNPSAASSAGETTCQVKAPVGRECVNADATYAAVGPNGTFRREVFGGKRPNNLGKLFAVENSAVKWRNHYAQPIISWLREIVRPQPTRPSVRIPDLFAG
ncbi:hypothetical protein [Bradyrhizobium sp. USDA 4454]